MSYSETIGWRNSNAPVRFYKPFMLSQQPQTSGAQETLAGAQNKAYSAAL